MENRERRLYDLQSRKGNILVTSMLVLVVMNLLGVGVALTSSRESNAATHKTIGSTVFQVTESCSRDAMKWLGDQPAPPEDGVDLPYQITAADLSGILTGTESSAAVNKLNGYSYDCEVTFIVSKTDAGSGGGTGVGGEVGETVSYGESGDLDPKYYYQIESNAAGPKNSSKQTFTIVSVEW